MSRNPYNSQNNRPNHGPTNNQHNNQHSSQSQNRWPSNDYENGLNQFEQGRKASRDYDGNYTGFRSSNDEGDIGHDRELWQAHRSSQQQNYRSDSNRSPSYDGRDQGYRNPEAQYRASSAAGKGPKGWKRTDERIREDVCQALENDHVIDATEIEVAVKDGVVTLSGHIETRPIKRRAEDLVETISGVRDVRNELAIDQSLFQQVKEYFTGDFANVAGATPLKPAVAPKH